MMIDRYIEEIAAELGKSPEFLKKAVICLEISNVARWFYEESSDEFESFDCFPNLAPSWPLTWAEYRVPDKINSHGKISPNRQREAYKHIGIYRDAALDKKTNSFYSLSFVFVENRSNILIPISRTVMQIDGNGKLVHIAATSNKEARSVLFSTNFYRDIYAANKDLVTLGEVMSKPFFFATSLLHCKNIKVLDPDCHHDKINRKRRKQGKLPLFRFKTLEISPMREVLRVQGQSNEVGLKRSLHICRAHFATYTKEAPLFGKIAGTFFKPMHVKGSLKQGVVVKDYTIRPPGTA